MNLYFIRHGETEHNKEKRYYGNLDVGLTSIGVWQIEKTAEVLKDINFNRVYVSERKRAKQTSEILLKNKNSDIIIDSRINEIDFGEFEGKNHNEIEEIYPEQWKAWCEDWKNVSPPNGESYVQFYNRIKNFMDELLKLKEDNVLIVTHGGVIKSIYCYVLNGDLDFFWKFSSKNAGISIIKYEYNNLYIDTIDHSSNCIKEEL
jgi:alpha-ribazole phosphatase